MAGRSDYWLRKGFNCKVDPKLLSDGYVLYKAEKAIEIWINGKEVTSSSDASCWHYHKAIVNPEDYEARSNIMWTATWALNTLIDRGKATDWMVHMLGQAVAAFTDATHGHTLAAVSGAYYRLLINKSDDAVQKFKRLAMNVWNVSAKAKTDKQVAMEGLEAMEQWMRELGLAMNITDCGAKPEQIEGMADACPICQGGYYILNRDEVVQVLKESL